MAWGILTFIATLAVPIAMYYVALRVLPHASDDVKFDYWPYGWDDASRIWKARGISIGAFFGVLILMWVPMLLWKLHGKSQVNKMLQRFENEDRAVRPNVPLPTYRIAMPAIGGSALVLTVTVPGAPAPTSFQASSQPPTYVVNAPVDPRAAAYGQGQAPPSMSDQGVPLYNQFDEKIPDYTGPPPGMYVGEKEEYETVQV